MFNAGYDQLRQTFLDQFEPDGDGYLYRNRQLGSGIAVNAEERDMFVKRFIRSTKWLIAISLVVTILLGLFWVIALDLAGYEAEGWWFGPPIALFLALVIPFSRRLWNAPLRTLGTRPRIGEERSRSDLARRADAQTTYRQLGALVLVLAAFMLRVAREQDLLVGWSRLWLVFAVIVIALVAFVAARKWRDR